ncbi:isopropylmalate isomerase [uncultured Ruegeria sp.]|uniref:isopropylmalate isomerase n=1 Tax=uncultured Ruegeria sp. TaxID=259304 RepID=UPI002607CAD3|nr:isopropylmalate isomerase [uncultured Ruegeria sp.]
MIALQDLHTCVTDQWSPTIGDPSPMGWATVAAYGATAILCFRSAHVPESRVVKLFWLALALLLLALMINKQLDLQSALTATARCLSQMQGWYEDRRSVQIGFILVVAFSGIWIALVSFWLLRKHLRHIGMALFGFVLLICFVLIRAAGFHRFDAMLNAEFLFIRVNWLLELTGIALIALNAIFASRHHQPRGME